MLKKILKYLMIFFGSLFLMSILSVFILKFVPVYRTPLMYIKSFSKDYEINHKWVALEDISKNFVKAVISAEDNKFYSHHGFDFEAIEKALVSNAKKKNKIKKGASTISQQTAKNVFLWPSRSWIRKGLEVYFTVLIETIWSKDRIMEVYLNVIEVGPGVYGVEAGSKKYFKKSAKNVSVSEAALIAAVLPNPILLKADKPSRYVKKRQSILSRYIRGQGGVSKPKKLEQKIITESQNSDQMASVESDDKTNNLEPVIHRENSEGEISDDLKREIEELNTMEEI